VSDPEPLFRLVFGKRSFEIHASETLTKLVTLAADELQSRETDRRVKFKTAMAVLGLDHHRHPGGAPEEASEAADRPRVTAEHMAAALKQHPKYVALSLFIEDLATLETTENRDSAGVTFSVAGCRYELRNYQSHGVAVVARDGVLSKAWNEVPAGKVLNEPVGYAATGSLHGILIGCTLSNREGSTRRAMVVEIAAEGVWRPYSGTYSGWLKTRLANDYVLAAVPTGHE
jgi:hypothetical protein